MKTTPPKALMLCVTTLLSTLTPQLPSAFAQSTAFTYSGRLNEAGQPVNGLHDLSLSLFTALEGGGPVMAVTNVGVTVSNGLFTTTVDFGSGVFDGTPYWLGLGVRPSGSSHAFALLEPRQPLMTTPYALYAFRAGQADSAQSAAAVTSGAISRDGLANGAVTTEKILDGTIALEDLSGPAQEAFWRRGGNAGTTAGTHFLGTTDNQALELKVNNQRALRLEPGVNGGAVTVIGGAAGNTATGVAGATIGGGRSEHDPKQGRRSEHWRRTGEYDPEQR